MLLRRSPVVVERALGHGVDAALQLVGRRRQRAAALEDGRIAEREQHAGPVRPDQSEVGAAQAFVCPPPLASPRVHGILFGDGALLEVIVVPAVPVVELLEPCGGLVGRRRPDEPAGESGQLPAGLALGPVRQVDAGVAQHMHQAALHVAGALRAAQPVRYRHVRSGDAREQRHIGGLALVRAPLEAQHLAVPAVDGYDQAPAVVHVRAVRHHRMMFHPARRDGGPDVPAPRGALAQGPRIAVRVARGLARAAEQPSKERVELPGPLCVLLWHRRAQRAGCALPALHPFAVRPFFFIGRPHTGHFFALLDFVLMRPAHHRDAPIFPPGKITPRHAYSHKAKPGL